MDTVEISLCLRCTVRRDTGNRWITGCPALDLFSQGKTEAEAKRCLEEAIGLWVDDCLERGTLDQALREVGFQRVHPGTIQPGDDLITVGSARKDDDLAADIFPIHISIPAYQAAALLSAHS